MTKSIDESPTSPADADVRFTADHAAAADGAEHLPSEITYDEQRYPARPTRLRPSRGAGCATPCARRSRATRRPATRST